MATTEPIRSKAQVKELTEFYKKKGQYRNYLLIVLSLHTALRISDLLLLRWRDVYDFKHQRPRRSICIMEKKTEKTKSIAVNPAVIAALTLCLQQNNREPESFLIENTRTHKAISRIQAYRLIRVAAEALQFQSRISCHSLRKTFGYHAWKSGVSPVILIDIYNHSSFAVTRRYLGVSQDDKDEVYLSLKFS